MSRDVFLIWNYIEWTTRMFDSYDQFIVEIHNLSELDWQQSTFHVIWYDDDYVTIDIWMDWELDIYDKDTWENLSVLVYEWKYNFDKARLFVLDKEYIRFLFRNNN